MAQSVKHKDKHGMTIRVYSNGRVSTQLTGRTPLDLRTTQSLIVTVAGAFFRYCRDATANDCGQQLMPELHGHTMTAKPKYIGSCNALDD